MNITVERMPDKLDFQSKGLNTSMIFPGSWDDKEHNIRTKIDVNDKFNWVHSSFFFMSKEVISISLHNKTLERNQLFRDKVNHIVFNKDADNILLPIKLINGVRIELFIQKGDILISASKGMYHVQKDHIEVIGWNGNVYLTSLK